MIFSNRHSCRNTSRVTSWLHRDNTASNDLDSRFNVASVSEVKSLQAPSKRQLCLCLHQPALFGWLQRLHNCIKNMFHLTGIEWHQAVKLAAARRSPVSARLPSDEDIPTPRTAEHSGWHRSATCKLVTIWFSSCFPSCCLRIWCSWTHSASAPSLASKSSAARVASTLPCRLTTQLIGSSCTAGCSCCS